MRTGGPILITGGAGFIGSNLAESFLAEGRDVIIFDALSRRGVENNLAWLRERFGARVTVQIADIRDASVVEDAVKDASAVIHLAAQVAVTTSLQVPRADFAVNGLGTLNVLEAVRHKTRDTPVIFASTNKVYGHLDDIRLTAMPDQYIPSDETLRRHGVSERQPLNFATPYGCSKGVADQYVLDYARTFGVKAAVLRMSCIYGPRQFGTEDQGWVAHFLIRAMSGEPITIYGDGRQVRDVLHVADAVRAYRRLLAEIDVQNGRAFNLGGGPANAVSLKVMLTEIQSVVGHALDIRHADWRPGDQLYFVADTRAAARALGWHPQWGWRDGVRDLASWIGAHTELIRRAREPGLERMIA